MKKLLSLLLVGILGFGLVSCNTAEENQNAVIEQKPMVVVITDVGGIGDHSFNDVTLSALEEVQEDEDIDIRCLEAETKDDYEGLIREAVNEDAVLIIAVGSNLKDAVEKSAQLYPETYFGLVDARVELDNVVSLGFADNESGFLAGYAAASTSKTGKIGFIGGEKRSTVDLFRYGYIAGAKAANPNIVVETDYIGTFYDEEKGYDVADKMIKKDVDVVMHVAGASGLGVIKAAKTNDVWAIGADKDQSHLASKNVLCSAVKDLEPGVKDMVKMALKGDFKGEYHVFNLKEDGVALSDSAGNIKGELKETIKDLTKKIESEKIVVPTDENTLSNFSMED